MYVPAISTCSKRCSKLVERERRRVTHEARCCDVCGEEFTPKRSDARYCSNSCRQDAYRKRKLGGSPAA
jgi:transposase